MEKGIHVFGGFGTDLHAYRDTVLASKVLTVLRGYVVSTCVINFGPCQTEHGFTWCELLQLLDPLLCLDKRLLVSDIVKDQSSFRVTQVHSVEHHELVVAWHVVQLEGTNLVVHLQGLFLDGHEHVLRLLELIAEAVLCVAIHYRGLAGACCADDYNFILELRHF